MPQHSQNSTVVDDAPTKIMHKPSTVVFSCLEKFNLLTSNPYDIDKIYRLLYYSLRLVGHVTHPKLGGASSWLAVLAAKVWACPPSDERAFTKRVNELADVFGECRMVMRLFGSLATIPSVMATWQDVCVAVRQNGRSRRALVRPVLEFIQIASCLFYYPLDNLYWLHTRRVLVHDATWAAFFSQLSCQAWLVYILLDALLLIDSHFCAARANLKNEGKKDEKRSAGVKGPRALTVWRSLLADGRWLPVVCDFVLALKWSFPKHVTFVSPFVLACAGTLSSVANVRSRWRAL
jgi:hypothetical protein